MVWPWGVYKRVVCVWVMSWLGMRWTGSDVSEEWSGGMIWPEEGIYIEILSYVLGLEDR